jgi:hypothetical protein
MQSQKSNKTQNEFFHEINILGIRNFFNAEVED